MKPTMKLTNFFYLAAIALLAGCATPKTFVKTMDSAWASVEVRDDLTYINAWNAVVDTLIKRFDMEILSQQDGYARTTWLYSWTGKVSENYRVRVTTKFSPDHKVVEVKSEAEYGGPGNWVAGYDTRLLETIKTDIMGKVGRTTR
jgi:ribosomal protein S17E